MNVLTLNSRNKWNYIYCFIYCGSIEHIYCFIYCGPIELYLLLYLLWFNRTHLLLYLLWFNRKHLFHYLLWDEMWQNKNKPPVAKLKISKLVNHTFRERFRYTWLTPSAVNPSWYNPSSIRDCSSLSSSSLLLLWGVQERACCETIKYNK